MAAGWSSLPADLLNEISGRLIADADQLHAHQLPRGVPGVDFKAAPPGLPYCCGTPRGSCCGSPTPAPRSRFHACAQSSRSSSPATRSSRRTGWPWRPSTDGPRLTSSSSGGPGTPPGAARPRFLARNSTASSSMRGTYTASTACSTCPSTISSSARRPLPCSSGASACALIRRRSRGRSASIGRTACVRCTSWPAAASSCSCCCSTAAARRSWKSTGRRGRPLNGPSGSARG
uniref:Uncharacterized protein n=1 Tax=Aegilops tauschii subsp. strangulata TaxID=200361 RepID=A0A452YJD9_AEGTS